MNTILLQILAWKNTSFQNLYLQSIFVSFTYLCGRAPAFIDGALWCVFSQETYRICAWYDIKIRIKVTNATFNLESFWVQPWQYYPDSFLMQKKKSAATLRWNPPIAI